MFCPKLCRSACPVSNAEPRETLTPWGKMSMAYFAANGSVPVEPSYAAPAWACTGCFGCRESCDHRNDVTGTLFEARSALVTAGVAPEAAMDVIRGFATTEASLSEAAERFASMPEVRPDAKTALLLGCAYARSSSTVARDAIRATAKLTGDAVSIATACCGGPLLYAGDGDGFARQRSVLAASLEGKERVVVLDAGCATTIRVHHASKGLELGPSVEHFVELAGRRSSMLQPTSAFGDGVVRYHDPCQLGRGLGVYDAPRAILARALGRPPEEFARRREDARCSGAGGILPKTMPETSAAMADVRIAEHDELGGGTIVTACASSHARFEAQGAKTLDLVTIVARALGIDAPR